MFAPSLCDHVGCIWYDSVHSAAFDNHIIVKSLEAWDKIRLGYILFCMYVE